jgi:hypothetical protein
MLYPLAIPISRITGISRAEPLASYWRRGWDSNQCWVLKTKNLRHFRFLSSRPIRQKAQVETRIEHVEQLFK